MNIRSIIQYGHGTWSVAMCAALLLLAGCQRDELVGTVPDKDMLNFRVGISDKWNHGSVGSTADSTAVAAEEQPKETAKISPVRTFFTAGAPEADSLYLHTLVANTIEGTSLGGGKAETRGTPIDKKEQFYDSFGLFGYLADDWSDELAPDYLYNIEVKQSTSGYWSPASKYYWPGGDQGFFLWAYAPYGCEGLTVPASAGGSQVFTYTVPRKAQEQQDLLMAEPDKIDGEPESGTLELKFRHVLTAVRFVTGDDIRPGSIGKITLKNMHGEGTYGRTAAKWELMDEATKEFVCEFDPKSFDNTPDVQIQPDEATFMMLPQQLSESAEVEVEFTDEKGGGTYALTAKLANDEWPMGKTVTYRISMSSINEETHLQVVWEDGKADKDFTYLGGNGTFKVVSNTTVMGPDNSVVTVEEPWSVTFLNEDGNELPAKPEWLTGFPANGNGSQSYSVSASPQSGVTDNPHTEALRNAADINTSSGQTPYNLSNADGADEVERTANCYVINAPGTYSLPLVYGNAIDKAKNPTSPYHNENAYTSSASGSNVLGTFLNHKGTGITQPYIYDNDDSQPAYAKLVWQDAEGLVSGVELLDNNHRLVFTVNRETIAQGNAVVAVCNASGQVMWSWHIWVTDYVLGTDLKTVSYSGTHKLLPYNLGWCDGTITTYEGRSIKVRFTQDETGKQQVITVRQEAYTVSVLGNQPFYQWGRKDPMLPSAGTDNTNKTWYDASGTSLKTLTTASWSTGDTAITNGILNPGTYCTNMYMDQKYYNLWSADNPLTPSDLTTSVKTVYDPCPVGYKVPLNNAFRAFTTTGSNTSTASQINGTWNAAEKGWDFNCTEGTVFFPASGYRNSSSGSLRSVGSLGYYWSAVSNSESSGRYLSSSSTYVNPLVNHNRATGFPVRPVAED